MKTTSAEFLSIWGNTRNRKAIYKITYKRRYWNGSAYVLEAAAKTITRREIDRVGAVSARKNGNRIASSNVSLALLDKSYKWLPTNTANGVWRKDATATLGYEPIGSEFTIHYGYALADETEEYLSMFVGRIDDDPTFDSTSGIVTISLVGLAESKLEITDAQAVCTTLTDQATTPTTGNGVLLAFAGLLKSIWEMTNIRAAAVTKTLGTDNDFTIADLNDAELVPTINFNAGKAPTGTILYNARQWYRDKSIAELAGLVCDAAGITAAFREIEEPIFPNIDQSNTFDTQAEWDAAGTQFDALSIPGTLRRRWFKIDDFTDNDYTTSPVWTIRYNSNAGTVSAATGALVVTVTNTPSNLDIDTPLTSRDAYGTWEFSLRSNGTSGDTGSNSYVNFIQSGPSGYGYYIRVSRGSNVIEFGRQEVARVPLRQLAASSDSSAHTYRITRTTAGLFSFYQDGVLLDTYTDTQYTTTDYFGVRVTYSQAGTLTTTVDNIYFSNGVFAPAFAVTDADMDWISAEIDLLAAPSSWLPIQIAQTLNSGTVTVKTNVASISGGPYDGAVATDSLLVPQSALKRYFKLEIIGARATGAYLAPEFTSARVNWRGTSLFIKSADFTGMSGLEAIAELAKMGGMDYGTWADGIFYFKNRTVTGAADMNLSQKTAIIAVNTYTPGYKDVKPIAQVRYGKSGDDGYYFSEYKASDAGEASPTTAARFGSKVVSMDLTKFLFSNNANVAQAIAAKLYTENYRPKRKLRIKCRIIPHLETTDRVKINFHDSPLIEKAIFGDPLQRFPVTGPNARTLARDIIMKVVGLSTDINKSESVLDLEEMLT